MYFQVMKKVITEMMNSALVVTISAPDCEDVVLNFPVNMVSPEVALHVAACITKDAKIPQPVKSNETAEK